MRPVGEDSRAQIDTGHVLSYRALGKRVIKIPEADLYMLFSCT